MTDKFRSILDSNIKIFYVTNFLLKLEFFLPIWIKYQAGFISISQIATLTAFNQVAQLALELPTGALADIIGRKKTIALGNLIIGLSYISFIFFNDFWGFAAAYLLMALGDALTSGADESIIYDTYKSTKQENLYPKFVAINSAYYRIALGISAILGGYLFGLNTSIPFVLSAVACFVSAIFALFLKEPSIDSEKFTLNNYINQIKLGTKEIFKNLYTFKLSVFYILISGITWTFLAYYIMTFVYDLGFNDSQSGWVLALAYAVSSYFAYRVSTQFDTLDKNKVYLAFPIVLSLALIPAALANKFVGLIIVIIVTTVAGARFSILGPYINNEFESKYRATALSALNMFVGIFFFVFVALNGSIQEVLGTGFVLSFLGVLALVAALPNAVALVLSKSNNSSDTRRQRVTGFRK